MCVREFGVGVEADKRLLPVVREGVEGEVYSRHSERRAGAMVLLDSVSSFIHYTKLAFLELCCGLFIMLS